MTDGPLLVRWAARSDPPIYSDFPFSPSSFHPNPSFSYFDKTMSPTTSLENLPTVYEQMVARGVSRRDFMKFCAWMSAYLGLEQTSVAQIAKAIETRRRIPVVWLHFQECTCCSESFLRSSHPIVADILLDKISLDYTETLQAAAGFQAEEILRLKGDINRLYASHTGTPIEKIERDVERDYFMSADEARAYGVIDEVLGTEADGGALVKAS